VQTLHETAILRRALSFPGGDLSRVHGTRRIWQKRPRRIWQKRPRSTTGGGYWHAPCSQAVLRQSIDHKEKVYACHLRQFSGVVSLHGQ
jgi:hypothetical protein